MDDLTSFLLTYDLLIRQIITASKGLHDDIILCQSWIRKIARQTGNVPTNFFLTGATRTSESPISGGGFSDIYMGEYAGRDVALRVIRGFEGEESQEHLKVSPRCWIASSYR